MSRVLIVENELLIALVLEDIIEMLGHDVAGNAASLTEGHALFDTLGDAGIDVAVLDVNLGSEPVYPLADRLAAAGTRIVFATGSHPDMLPDRFAGCDVLEKPYAFAAVEALLGKVLASA